MNKKIEARRRALRTIALGSGAFAAGKSLPATWMKPAVESVLLPAHAQTSPVLSNPVVTSRTYFGERFAYDIATCAGGSFSSTNQAAVIEIDSTGAVTVQSNTITSTGSLSGNSFGIEMLVNSATFPNYQCDLYLIFNGAVQADPTTIIVSIDVEARCTLPSVCTNSINLGPFTYSV